jgi:hypothetical protein
MKPEMRRKLAREPFAEKIRKVGQLVRLAKVFPRRVSRAAPVHRFAKLPRAADFNGKASDRDPISGA